MHALPLMLKVPLLAVVLLAGVYDIRSRRIPNWVVLAGLLIGIGGNVMVNHWAGLRTAGLGMALGMLVYLPLYALHGMGAGDVKLMAAIGAIVGPANWIGILIGTGLLGGVCALACMFLQGAVGRTFRNLGRILWEMGHLRMPYKGYADIDVHNPAALRLPHGAVIALAAIGFTSLSAGWKL